jgi:hypothetical protein
VPVKAAVKAVGAEVAGVGVGAEAGAGAGVCPFPHEQMAAALQSQPQSQPSSQAQAQTQSPTQAQAPAPAPTQPAPTTRPAIPVDPAVAQVLEAARQRARESVQQQQEAILAQQRELNLIPVNEVSATAGVEDAQGGGEEGEMEPEVDLLEGISESFLKQTPASAPAPAAVAAAVAAPVAVRAPVTVPVSAVAAPTPTVRLAAASLEQSDTEAFLDQTSPPSSYTPPSRLEELIQRTDEAHLEGAGAGTGAGDADLYLLADEVERWLALEEAARTQQ